MLTFETNQVQGATNIIEKLVVRLRVLFENQAADSHQLKSLPFEKTQHRIDTLDAQPSSTDGGVMVMVTGKLLVSPSCSTPTNHHLPPPSYELKYDRRRRCRVPLADLHCHNRSTTASTPRTTPRRSRYCRTARAATMS